MMKEECAGRPGGMMAQMKSESKTKIGLIDRDIGKRHIIFIFENDF